MRTLVLAGLLAGAAFLPAAPASAQCLHVDVDPLPECAPTCAGAAYGYADRAAGGALPDLPPLPVTVECTL